MNTKWFKEFYENKYDFTLPKNDMTVFEKVEKIKHYINKGDKILYLGCGPCIEGALLYKELITYNIGIDISYKILKDNKNCNLKIISDVSNSLPIKDKSVDVVIAFEIIEHLGFVDNFLTEIKRVLKDKGIFILSTPSLSYWKERIRLLFGKDILSDEHPRMFTPKTLKYKLEAHDFKIKKIIGIGRLGRFISVKYPFLSLAGDFLVVSTV